MKIILKELSLDNFKGSEKNTFRFAEVTNIYGANGTGKTTIADAFMWLLFGKDATDRKEFAIKPLDIWGKAAEKLAIEVCGTVEIDGLTHIIKRCYREKWVKRRGEDTAEYVGNETVFWWNDVLLSQKEFQERVAGILPENLFKIVTNPLYFHGLKWQDKRQILMELVGAVKDNDLVAMADRYKELQAILETGKSLDDYKKEIANKVKKVRDEMKLIPSRIDEASKSIKPITNPDGLANSIETKKAELTAIEARLKNHTKAHKAEHESVLALQRQTFEQEKKLDALVASIEKEIRREALERATQIADLKHEVVLQERLRDNLSQQIAQRITEIEAKKNVVYSLKCELDELANAEMTVDDKRFVCPTCKRVYDPADIQSQKQAMLRNFKQEKAKQKRAIRKKTKVLNTDIRVMRIQNSEDTVTLRGYKNKLEVFRKAIKALEGITEHDNDLDVLEQEGTLFTNERYLAIKANLASIADSIANRPSLEETDVVLLAQKDVLLKELDDLKALSIQQSYNAIQQKRILALEQQLAHYCAELNALERMSLLLMDFTRDKITMLEAKVNQKFEYVNFKMYDNQINGGEAETCEILFGGVPFADVNTAGKLCAGIDIINTLSEHFQIFAPIFCDNRESVTMIQNTKSQLINLFVSPADKVIRIG